MTAIPQLLDADIRLNVVAPDKIDRKIIQDIPDDFISDLRDERSASNNSRAGEMHRVASVPVALVEQWQAQGFNIYDKNVSVKDILARLKRENLTAFLTSNKAL